MKVALMMENSQAAKNPVILNELTSVADSLGHAVFNVGMNSETDHHLTYVHLGIMGAIQRKPEGHQIYNLGGHEPAELWTLVRELENLTQRKAVIQELPFQDGDVFETYADIDAAMVDLGFRPSTNLHEGLEKFICWYTRYSSRG